MPTIIPTPSVTNKIFNIGVLYGRISGLQNAQWFSKLSSFIELRAAISAVSIDKNILEKINLFLIAEVTNLKKILPPTAFKELQSYISAKESLEKEDKAKDLTLNFINSIHHLIVDSKKDKSFRKSKRLLSKQITENDIIKNVTLEVKTLPSQIPQKLEQYLRWLRQNIHNYDPILLAALTHFRVAEIHPYDDGNGRLCRLLDYFLLARGNMDAFQIVSLEYFFLLHSERYYQLLETTIETQHLGEWIEFYTDALLNSILDTAKIIYQLTGGAVDIKNNKIHQLSELEMKVIELMRRNEYSTPLGMAKFLGYSKQNICRILKILSEKGLIQKIGKNTGVRYRLY